MPPIHRKSAKARKSRGLEPGQHIVPLPPAAWAVVERAMELAGESDFLFPAIRDRRAGAKAETRAPETITHIFRNDIPGNKATPHDVRRAFATSYGQKAGLTDHQIKIVLDHSEGIISGDVTRTHYLFGDGSHEMWPILRGWCNWIEECANENSFKLAAE